jgi:hypothetical protein
VITDTLCGVRLIGVVPFVAAPASCATAVISSSCPCELAAVTMTVSSFCSLSVIRSGCLPTVSRDNDAHQRFQRLILQQPACVFHGLSESY